MRTLQMTVCLLCILVSVTSATLTPEQVMHSMYGNDQNAKDSLQLKLHKVGQLLKQTKAGNLSHNTNNNLMPVINGDIMLNHKMLDVIYGKLAKKNTSVRRGFKSLFVECPRLPENITYAVNFVDEFITSGITDAMQIYTSNTCLSFTQVPLTQRFNMLFSNESYCISDMCSDGQYFNVNLGKPCFSPLVSPGTAWHEIAHTLGMNHQQAREDRDEYVHIKMHRVDHNTKINFYKCTHLYYGWSCATPIPYDFTSVMHYQKNAFRRKGTKLDTIVVKSPYEHYKHSLGVNSRGPSFYDMKEVNRVYCDTTCPESGVECVNGGYANPAKCHQCLCPGGFGGTTCEQLEKSPQNCGVVLEATTHWQSFKTLGNPEDLLYNSLECIWQIRAPHNAIIQLYRISEFHTDKYIKRHDACYGNFLEVKYMSDMGLGGAKFCGKGSRMIVSKSKLMVVRYSIQKRFLTKSLRHGFIGKYRIVPTCESQPCLNGGNCTNKDAGYTCDCPQGFQGVQCDINSDTWTSGTEDITNRETTEYLSQYSHASSTMEKGDDSHSQSQKTNTATTKHFVLSHIIFFIFVSLII